MSRSDRRALAWVAAAILVITAVGLSFGVRTYHMLLDEAFRERSTAYAQAFAASASAWVDPVEASMLQAAARFLLVGSALYVEVVHAGETLIAERDERIVVLDPPPTDAVSTITVAQTRTPGGPAYLDIVVPLMSWDGEDGYVRVGIDRTSVVTRSRNATLAVVGGGLAIDAALIALVIWILAGRRRSARDLDARGPADARVVVGDLEIDRARKEVRLRGASVRLTPKQYALLSALAQEPERVFSERELVDEVWTDSPYADAKDVKQCVYLVRKRLAAVDPPARGLIVTVPGFGYRLVVRTDGGDDPELTGA